jgi:hypothetical protein
MRNDMGAYGGPGAHELPIISAVTGIQSPPHALPTELELQQNYPNPCNPSTVVRYRVPASSFVQLKVYSTAGKEIAVLVDQHQDAGEYAVTFRTGSLASGTYFYRLLTRVSAGGVDISSETKKLILLK